MLVCVQRMLIIPEEIWENVRWNESKLRPKTNGKPWKPPATGILIFEHVVLKSKLSQHTEVLQPDTQLMHQLKQQKNKPKWFSIYLYATVCV